jgi:hypothetical protein
MCASDVNNKYLASRALAYCEKMKERPDISMLALSAFINTNKFEMKFHCLSILQVSLYENSMY